MLEEHVKLNEVSKSYGGVLAVKGVTFAITRGTVHALVGENGAGKSTVSKMLAGAIAPSSGELLVSGRPVSYQSPRQAIADGVVMMDQELAMLPEMTVLDNVFLGSESHRSGLLQKNDQRRRFQELLAETGFELDMNTRVGELRMADQQKVEILRALSRNAELIVMDEPTAPLNMIESEQLLDVIRALRDKGTTIVYISHFLEEVLEIADNVTVMRDGCHVRTRAASEETTASLVQAMLGRSLNVAFPEAAAPGGSKKILEVNQLTTTGLFADISLDVSAGEIVGLAGLVGSGRTEVARALFGAAPYDSGRVAVDGVQVPGDSPRQSIVNGLMMLPESRQHDGLAMMRSVSDNMSMATLYDLSTLGFMSHGRQRAAVERFTAALSIRAESSATPVSSLSGGNQQKVVFAKCLMAQPKVLIVDEPTRGVDVGAKRAIYDLLVELAAAGLAVLLISSDLEEVLGLSHRVLVMRRGSLVAELTRGEATEERVLAAAFGTSEEA